MNEPKLYLDINKATPPGTPPTGPGGAASPTDGGGGGNDNLVPCPFGGGAECIKNGGNGHPEHKRGGSIMQEHNQALQESNKTQGVDPKNPKAGAEESKPGAQQEAEAAPTEQQKVQSELASQSPTKQLVSSGAEGVKNVSSPAAKLEQNKQSAAERSTIPIPASEQVKIKPNPAEMARAEMKRLQEERLKANPEDDKETKEAKKQLKNEKIVEEAASKKGSKKKKKDSEKRPTIPIPASEQSKIKPNPAEIARTEMDRLRGEGKKEKKAAAKEPKKKEPKKPANAKDKLIVQHHNDQVKTLKDNIRSNVRWNKDLSPDERQKLRTIIDALDAHGTLQNMPEADHKRLLQVAKQMAGGAGKKKFETKKETAAKEAKPKKKTPKQQMKRIEQATGQDKKAREKAKAKETSLRDDPNRLRGENEPPPLPDKKKQDKMRLEVDRQKKKEAAQKEREKKAEDNKKAREQAQWDKKIEAAKEKIRENTEAPNSPEGVQEQQAFKKQSKELADNIRTHLESGEVDENTRTELENTLKILDTHSDLTGIPSQEQKKAQATAKKLAGAYGKPPKEPKGEKEPKEKKKRPTPFGKWARAGYAAGQAAGQAASTPEAAGGAVDAPAYGVRGAAAMGHHLLHNRKVDKENKEAKKAPKKGAEVEQSSMGKSLGLYIDLMKAGGQGPSGTTNTPTPEQSKRRHEASYKKNPVGVANEGLVSSTEDDDNEEELEKKYDSKAQQRYMHSAAERGDISEDTVEEFDEKTKDFSKLPEKVKKSFEPSRSMLKSLTAKLDAEIRSATPSSLEAEFMVDVLGYDVSAVRKGICFIKGRDRHRFNEWAADRLSKSISNLTRGLV